MIEKGKQYRTREGREVRIYATDGAEPYPIHGAIATDSGLIVASWRASGESIPTGQTHLDLIEVKPRIKGWVNVYRRCGRMVYIGHESQEEATKRAGVDRIACLPIDGEEGEGL